MIKVEHLSVTYSRTSADGTDSSVEVLRDLNFEIQNSEFCVIVGPSGAGKTTFLRVAQGLLRPTAGSLNIDGVTVDGPRRDCGFVFQNFGLLPWRSVQSNVELGLQIRHLPRNRRKEIASHYIKMVGLERIQDHHPHELSGGMQQRVGIGTGLGDRSACIADGRTLRRTRRPNT